MNNILTEAELRSYQPDLDLSKYASPTISGMIQVATKRMAGFANVLGFDFAEQTEKARTSITSRSEFVIDVRRRPLHSVSSVNVTIGGQSSALTLADSAGNLLYDIPDPGNRLVISDAYFMTTGIGSQLSSLRGGNTFAQITYVGGYQTVPEDLKYAASLYAKDTATQKDSQGLSGFSQGSYSESYDTSSNSGKSQLIEEAESILRQGGYVNAGLF